VLRKFNLAATEYVFIQGKLSWVKCEVPNEWGKWTATIHPNQTSLDKIRELQGEGVKNVLKKDDDGYYTTFSRPTSKMIKGKVVGMAPPEVLQADGKTPLKGILVGNGSDGTIKLEVYQHGTPGGGKAKAARLLSIKVDNLIPFELKRDFSAGQQEAVAGLAEQKPEQLF
jgi:hypothetical protein